MELYLDTSDVAAVKKLARIFPLAGVTTNPSIVAAGKTPLDELLPAAEEYGEHHISIYGVVTGMALMAVSLIVFS